MVSARSDRFVRVSTELLEALLRSRLSGAQWRVLLWAIRCTDGWNREWTLFTWYGIARELGLDRAATFRAGRALLRANVLISDRGRLAVQRDVSLWDPKVTSDGDRGPQQLWIPEVTVAQEQRPALSGNNASVAGEQRKRCQETTLFRRAKDRCKDRLKTYKDKPPQNDDTRHRSGTTANGERPHLAGAAKPIPGKI